MIPANSGVLFVSESKKRFTMNLLHFWRKGILTVTVIVGGGFLFPAYANSLNLLVNGSFENPVVPGNSLCGVYPSCIGFHNGVAGNDNIGGWQLIGKGGIDSNGLPIPDAPPTIMLLGYNYAEINSLTNSTLFFHPQQGLQSVDVTGEGNQGTTNGIKQVVNTSPGAVYNLSFWVGHQYSYAPGFLNGPGALELYIDGQSIGSFLNFGNTVDDVTWQAFQYSFTASSNQTVIAFVNATPVGNNYAGLDNVSLVSVPEPMSIVLLGLGAAGLSLARRKVR